MVSTSAIMSIIFGVIIIFYPKPFLNLIRVQGLTDKNLPSIKEEYGENAKLIVYAFGALMIVAGLFLLFK